MQTADSRPVGSRATVPALVLGKGVTALAALRCLGRLGVPLYVGGTPGDLVMRSRWYRPLPVELASEDLASGLETTPFERLVLMPTSDRWALSVSRLPERLRSRFPSTVAPTPVLERLVLKSLFACALEEFAIPHPRTFVLRDAASARTVPADAFTSSFLKPVQSGPFAAAYGAKAIRFGDRDEALRLVDEAAARGFDLMLQEFIPGPADRHCFVEGFLDRRGRLCGLLARRRIRMYPRDFGNSTSTETIPLPEVSAAADTLKRLLDGIGYRGVFSAEFKLDERDGLFKILEVNARPWWFAGFAAACGLNVFDMAYHDALGDDVVPVISYAIGRRCVAPRLDLEAGLADWRAGRLRLASLFRFWLGADQLTLCRDDPKPSLNEIFTWSKLRLRRKLGL